MRKYSHISAIMLLIALLSVVACRDYGTPGGIDNNLVRNIVTFEGINENGMSEFSYQAYDDSPLIPLVATNFADTSWAKGKRVMIQYYNLDNNTHASSPQEINITGIVSTMWDSLRYAPQGALSRLQSNPIRLQSMWRSGKYININTQLQTTDSLRFVGLLVNAEVLAGGTHATKVKATFIDDILGRRPYYYRQAILSFDTQPLWDSFPQCDTLEIEVNDLNFPDVKYYRFSRPAGL